MTSTKSVLIIEDQPFISEAYKSILKAYSVRTNQIDFRINIAHDCDSAYAIINKAITNKKKPIDLVFLDISIIPSKTCEFLSGEDIGLALRKQSSKTKIIVITALNNNYRIYSLVRSLNPDGFLVKNDVTSKIIEEALESVLNEKTFYSQTVMNVFRKQVSSRLDIDEVDRRLLFELSNGARLRDLNNILPLSTAGIEKRRRRLRDIFNIDNQNDRDLVIKAKERGFI